MTTQNTPTTAQHTPGPWHVDTRLTGHRFNGEPVRYYSVAHTSEMRDCFIATEVSPVTLITSGGEMPNMEGEANARLIAAAPNLLTSLRRLYEATYGRTDLVCQLDFEQARAAIAKAINT